MKTLLYGAGGHGRAVLSVLRSRKITVAGIVDDSIPVGRIIDGVAVLGSGSDLASFLKQDQDVSLALGIGDNEARSRAVRKAREEGISLLTIIEDGALLSPSVELEAGVVVFAGAIIKAGCRIGIGSVLNAGCILGHDVVVGDCCHISLGVILGGGVVVEDRAFLGLGSRVLPRLTVGSGSVVGAGSVVTKHVPAGVVVTGIPAHVRN